MESIIRDNRKNNLAINKLFSQRHFGFQNGWSTVTQLLNILDKCQMDRVFRIRWADKEFIYKNLEKAFDKIPHLRLLSKLESCNVKIEIIHLIVVF